MTRCSLAILVSVLPPTFGAAAAAAPLKSIDTSELAQKMAAAPPAHWDFTLIDARSRVEFEEAHIDGALNIPTAAVRAQLPKLIKDRHRALIFYCNGPRCTKSRHAAQTAQALGYGDVTEYNDGIPGWGKAGHPLAGKPLPAYDAPSITPGALQAVLTRPDPPVLLDIRDAAEFAQWKIPGSRNVPLDELAKHAKDFGNWEICLVDHAGFQLAVAARLLHSLGVSRLTRLDGGVLAWQSKGFPVEVRH